MNAFILSIGDELSSGLTVNTNSAWLAEQLGTLGIRALAHVTVGDDLTGIATAIRDACEYLESRLDPAHKSAVLLITGGLGPTEDDLTRQGVADALNQELVEDAEAMLHVERFFKSINRPMAPSNRTQALRPSGAEIIENPAGTAPGLRVRKDRVDIFVMPGVPREMKEMFTQAIRPLIEAGLAGAEEVTRVTKINTFGLGESNVGEKIQDLMARRGRGGDAIDAAGVTTLVGTTVHDGIVSVRIYATGPREQADAATERLRGVIHERWGALIFSEGDAPRESVVAELLRNSGRTIATAESCTGGLLAMLLTNTAGSSAYFLRGWVTYANAAKIEELGVSPFMLSRHGAVSEMVAKTMAQAARRLAAADIGIGITGIAGPEGGSADKPVGTVWIGLASGRETLVRKYIFPGARGQVRLRAAQMALALLRWRMLGVTPP